MPMVKDKDAMKSPLARAKGLGSAHAGLEHWLHVKYTAIANVPLLIWLVYSIVDHKGASYAEFTGWLAQPLNAILMILTIISVMYHARLGAQTIVEDYIHCEGLKQVKLIGQKFAFLALAVACIFSVLKIAL